MKRLPMGESCKRILTRPIRRCVSAALKTGCALLFCGSLASASGVTSFAEVRTSDLSGPLCLHAPATNTPGVSVGATCLWNGVGGFADASASAIAGIGELGVSVAAKSMWTDGLPAPGITASAEATASFMDTLKISTGSQLVLLFDIAGSGDVPAFFHDENCTAFCSSNFWEVFPPGGKFPIVYGFSPGVPFSFDIRMDTSTGATPGCNDLVFPPKCSASNLGNYIDTAKLSSVQVLDSQGNPVTKVAITSDSRFDYAALISGPEPQPVPEPATWLLMAPVARLLFARCRARTVS